MLFLYDRPCVGIKKTPQKTEDYFNSHAIYTR